MDIISWIVVGFIVLSIIGLIMMYAEKIKDKQKEEKLKVLMDSDLEEALKEIVKRLRTALASDMDGVTDIEGYFTSHINEYEKNLATVGDNLIAEHDKNIITAARKIQLVDAMLKLCELYEGRLYDNIADIVKSYNIYTNKKFMLEKVLEKKKDIEKANRSARNANAVKAEMGDLKAIIDYYGFSDTNVNSNRYDEILRNLNNVKPQSSEEEANKQHLTGIVYYKSNKIDDAKKLFIPAADKDNKSKFMLACCYESENNFSEVDKLLYELESADWKNHDDAILGRIYHNCGVAYLTGNYGVKKDIKKAICYYKDAANLNYINSMAVMGVMMINGEYEGTIVNRDYIKINEYLVKAKIAGNENAKDTLKSHGVDDIIIKTGALKPATYKFMDGHELTTPLETLKSLQLTHGIRYKAFEIADAFPAEYDKNITSFEQLMNGIHILYSEHIAQMIQWCLKVLMWYGIDAYDANAILEECDDLDLLPRVPRFEQGLNIIDNRAEQLNIKLAYTQATRRVWVGGGFGTTISGTIAASVKGSVAAGVMNVGSGILHSIGDSIVGAMNNSEIRGMEKKLFENPNTKTEFNNAVRSACLDIGNTLQQLIEKHLKIKFVGVKGNIKYQGENLSSIDDRTLVSKINNNLAIGKIGYVYALLIEKLRRSPISRDTYNQLSELTLKRHIAGGDDGSDAGIRAMTQFKGDFGL